MTSISADRGPQSGDSQPHLVVVGLGYVGLPLVREATRSGRLVTGLDLDVRVVADLNQGRSHIDDISNEDLGAMIQAGFRATSDPDVLARAIEIVVCVPTPLSLDGGPDLAAVKSAMSSIVDRFSAGTLVVLESTTWPGTTEEVVKPLLESRGRICGSDFFLAFSPERIDPGNEAFGFRNTPKVVGGITSACLQRAVHFYEHIVDQVVLARGTREAEMAKLLENTYRHVNIALVNEMAKFSHELGIDFWDVIACASTKPFGFQRFAPGPGVGGHCIPIDPNYLSHRVRTQLGYPFRFVELAQEVNQSMPAYVATRVQAILNDDELAIKGSNILLLGVTYKAGIADVRESPARPLAACLTKLGAIVRFHDPLVDFWDLEGGGFLKCETDLIAAVAAADVTVLLQAHDSYDLDAITRTASRMFDTRGVVKDTDAHRL